MKAISKMKSLILKYRHAWVLLYGLIYMPWFCYLEKRQTIHYLIHSPLDDYIPFVEYFIIPYLLWFVFLAVTGAFFFFTNGLNLRPVTFPRENIFTDLVRMIYSVDTPTNVLPSIHVYNSIGAMAAIAHSTSLKKHRGVQISSYVLGILIIFSTVFLKQHSITDVIAALAMACMIYPFVYATQEKKETKLSQQLI